MLGRVENLVDRAVLDLAAAPHHDHVVGHLRHHAHVVGDEHDGGVQVALQLAHDVENLRLDRHVKRRGRLVGNQQRGLAGQRHRNHGALAHAAGQRMGIGVEQPLGIGQAHLVEQRAGLRARLQRAQALVQDQRFSDLVANREHRVQRCHRLLKNHGNLIAANFSQGVLAGLCQVQHAAAGRLEHDLARHDFSARIVGQPHDGLRGHGLARTGLANDGQRPPGRDIETQAVHRAKASAGDLELHCKRTNGQQRRWGK